MSRIDKYDSKDGGFRAPLGFVVDATLVGVELGVGLDANGRVQRGNANTGVKGVLVLTQTKAVGDIVDVMTDGELVEFGGVPGTNYYAAAADGVVSADNTGTYVGCTVEGTRLVVRSAR